jgi:hypothetical protein
LNFVGVGVSYVNVFTKDLRGLSRRAINSGGKLFTGVQKSLPNRNTPHSIINRAWMVYLYNHGVCLSVAPEFEMGGSFMFYGTNETHGTHAPRSRVIALLKLSLHVILAV